MKILAIGGAGNVGSEVVKELLKRKAQVDVFVRNPDAKVPQGARVAVGDLLDPGLWRRPSTESTSCIC